MFQFESIELLYWDYWQRVKIPLDERIVVIVGPNGSGKTTLLDAMRTLLGLKTSSKRDYKRYARRSGSPYSWIVAVVKNIKDTSNRPCFYPLFTEKVTLGCRIEKKGGEWQRSYIVKPGEVSLEELIETPQTEMMGLREYKGVLERAGLSGAMLRVLTLEQGATDRLCEYSPKELLSLVYEAFGDKTILDNYEKAREDQIEAHRELESLKLKVEKLENQLSILTNKVNNYLEYKRLVEQKTYLETEVTAVAEYTQKLDYIQGLRRNITGTKREVAESGKRMEELEETLGALHDKRKKAEEEKRSLEDKIEQLHSILKDDNSRRATAEAVIGEIERLRQQCQGIQPEDMAALESAHDEALRLQLKLQTEKEALEEELRTVQAGLSALRAGTIRPQRPIEEFRQVLKNEGIGHHMLYEGVEIKDDHWRLAIESLLRPYRFVIVLERAEERWKAWQLGEEAGYRHFIVPEPGAEKVKPRQGTALQVVELKDWVPLWIRQLLGEVYLVDTVEDGRALPEGTTFVTSRGYIRERRGGRSIAVTEGEFVFGLESRRLQITYQEARVEKLRQEITEKDRQIAEAHTKVSELKERLKKQQALRAYLQRRDEENALRASLEETMQRIVQTEQELEGLNETYRQALDNFTSVCVEISKLQTELNSLRAEFETKSKECGQMRAELLQKLREFRKFRAQIPVHWRSPEKVARFKDRYGDIRNVHLAIEEIDRRLSEGEWVTDPQVTELKAKVEKDYQYELENLKQKEYEFEETRRVTEEARAAYINVLRASIRFYEQNLRALAGLAGVEIEVIKPHLENDDTVLREAGLEVRWNFDGKGFAGTDDGEASGGQQVIKSLVLLIALMMDERSKGGFVFIDEPFAHLDVFNIDRVAEFLLATETQFIITTPNTHNTNIYRPAMLSIVTKKKRPGEAFAPPPAHIRRLDA